MTTGPESMTDAFVRIGFTGDAVRAFAGRGRPSGKTRDRMVKAAPPKMDRAALADELPAKVLEHLVNDHQREPVLVDILRVVRRMSFVLMKANGAGDFDRHRPEVYIDVHAFQSGHYSFV